MTAATTHKVRWFVYAGTERIPFTATMRGRWDFDAVCSCGWDTRTGGAVRSYIRRVVADHKLDAKLAEENDARDLSYTAACQRDECGQTHPATYSHEGQWNEGPIFAVVCDDNLTDYYTVEGLDTASRERYTAAATTSTTNEKE